MPSQNEIAAHLDLSQQRISVVLRRLGLDARRATLTEIRLAYLRDLESKALTTGGSSATQLRLAKTRESNAKAQNLNIVLGRVLSELVAAADIYPEMSDWGIFAKRIVAADIEKFVIDVEDENGICVDGNDLEKAISDAFQAIDSWQRFFGNQSATAEDDQE